jgi:hypothetical protein
MQGTESIFFAQKRRKTAPPSSSCKRRSLALGPTAHESTVGDSLFRCHPRDAPPFACSSFDRWPAVRFVCRRTSQDQLRGVAPRRWPPWDDCASAAAAAAAATGTESVRRTRTRTGARGRACALAAGVLLFELWLLLLLPILLPQQRPPATIGWFAASLGGCISIYDRAAGGFITYD